MSITWHRGFKHVLSGVALSALMAGFVAFTAAPAHAADEPKLVAAPNFDNTTHVVERWIWGDEVGNENHGRRWKMALDDPSWARGDVELVTYEHEWSLYYKEAKRNQQWHFTRQKADGSYELRNVFSGKCVTATPAGPVKQAECKKGRTDQHWIIKEHLFAGGSASLGYQFVNVSTRKALSQFGHPSTPKPFDPTANGAKVFQSKPNINDKYQFWKIVR